MVGARRDLFFPLHTDGNQLPMAWMRQESRPFPPKHVKHPSAILTPSFPALLLKYGFL